VRRLATNIFRKAYTEVERRRGLMKARHKNTGGEKYMSKTHAEYGLSGAWLTTVLKNH
jgi:hypothetical protein